MQIETRDLGLAAFVKMAGEPLVEFHPGNRVFVFESDREIIDWRVEYLNSESYRHDSELMNLRKLFV